ncbi:hypothetical protein [Nitrospira sp. Kam-Ns4a]
MKWEIGTAVVARRFQRRRRRGAAAVALAVAGSPTLVVLARSDVVSGLLPHLFIALAGAFVLIAVSVFYVLYRCPNCNARPWGRTLIGVSARRCPSCKIGLTVPDLKDEP